MYVLRTPFGWVGGLPRGVLRVYMVSGWVRTTYILIILREINILKAFSSQLTFSFPTTEIALPFFIGAACF